MSVYTLNQLLFNLSLPIYIFFAFLITWRQEAEPKPARNPPKTNTTWLIHCYLLSQPQQGANSPTEILSFCPTPKPCIPASPGSPCSKFQSIPTVIPLPPQEIPSSGKSVLVFSLFCMDTNLPQAFGNGWGAGYG